MNGDGGSAAETEMEEVEEEMVIRVVRPLGTGLGISIAGGVGATPFRGNDEVSISWLRSIVVRTPVLAGELSLSCTRLMAGRVTTLWVKRPLSVNQHGQLSQPSLRGRLNE